MTKSTECDSNGTIAVLTDEYVEYPKLVVDIIAAALNKRGFGLLCIAGRELAQVHQPADSAAACNAIYSLINQSDIKGLISISGSIGHNVDISVLSNFLNQFQLPMVSVGIPAPDTPSVLMDDLKGMRQLMDHLLDDPNRQRLAFIRGYPNDPYSRRREKVFRDVLIERNRKIDESLFIEGNYDKFETYAAVSRQLENDARIDAFVAANDVMALSAARAIAAKNLRIPQDIAVTGFDDTRDATQYSPALTTVRQPVETFAANCVELLLTTMESYTGERGSKVSPQHTSEESASKDPTVITIESELIPRGSTMGASRHEESSLVFSADGIYQLLRLSLSGLGLPPNVDLQHIAEAFWHSVETGSDQLQNYFATHLNSSVSFEDIHWWSNLCFQLDHHTNLLVEHFGSNEWEPQIRTMLANARELAWSASLDQEFKLNRLKHLQNRMQLEMSSCTESSGIFVVLTDWLDTLGASRCFLARFEEPGATPSNWSTMAHVYRDGKVNACPGERFRSNKMLPESLRHELEHGLLIMCPVHAGDTLFGYILLDPAGLDHLDLETTSNSIGNAMRSQYLIQTLEKQKVSLQSANQELYKLAQFDALTGLPNRLQFQQRLSNRCEVSLMNQSRFALLFIDLDGFKHVNDTLGHDMGDQLLQAVAIRLNELMGLLGLEDVFVARLGGDEFTVIVGDANKQFDIVEFIDRVLESLAKSFDLQQHVVAVSSSIGCAFFPTDGSDADTLVKHADTAMYHAKAQGKDCRAFFKPEMSTAYSGILHLDQDMRTAIANHEFCLYFQPKIDLASGDVCGVEALMRWLVDTPTGKTPHSSPDEFIPVAESTGFITQLDLYGLEQACQVARRWELEGRPLAVAVNLSVVFLQKDNVVDLISEVLNRYQLAPSLLEFEITESAVMTEVESNIVKIGQLRDMGIRISIDDFGTGYSSLNYLKKLPINSLKIDRSFISDLDLNEHGESVDESIVRSVVALGKSLDLLIVAEGVETEAQRSLVTSMGCEQAQGYLFAKPLPVDELETFLEHRSSYSQVA